MNEQSFLGRSLNPSVQGVRRFCELMAVNPHLSATAIQTVGCKGYDKLAIARVIDPKIELQVE